jgi:hypothetical protein
MKRPRVIATAMLALFVLAALAAFGASLALAEEGVLEPGTFTGKGGVFAHKNLNNEEVRCQTAEGEGGFLSEKEKDQHGEGTVTLKGCTALGFPANTLGDPSGTIKGKGLFLICLTNSATLLFGVLVQPTETVHGEVPLVKLLLLLKGAVIGSLGKAGELKGKTFEGVFNEKDEAKRLECEINGKKFKSSFEASVDTTADVDSFEVASGTITFAKEVMLMDK